MVGSSWHVKYLREICSIAEKMEVKYICYDSMGAAMLEIRPNLGHRVLLFLKYLTNIVLGRGPLGEDINNKV